MNMCYWLLSAPQTQFKTEKKRVIFNNFVRPIRYSFSQLKKRKQIFDFIIQNFVKLANHRMTHIRHLSLFQSCLIWIILDFKYWETWLTLMRLKVFQAFFNLKILGPTICIELEFKQTLIKRCQKLAYYKRRLWWWVLLYQLSVFVRILELRVLIVID